MRAISATELLRVLQFGDSTLPVGAFSFSNSLESALQAGEVHDADTLGQYVRAACLQTAGLDGVALLAAHRAACRQDLDGVLAADEALMLRRVGEEQQLMTTIYISHSDPDFYFGLDVLHAAFPDAKVVATPQTVAEWIRAAS